jgi:predicted HTH transcriptional regulator
MTSESRGHVEQRAIEALEFPAELAGVEFKGNYDFETLKFKITKTAMALANLRDGGQIIVGVSQDDSRNFVVEGITPTNVQSFIHEVVYEFVNRYASPPVELRVLQVPFEGKEFAVISVSPFERTPVVCRRNTPDGTPKADQMHEGAFYVRTTDRVGTERVKTAAMMSDLLELATVRRMAEQDRLRREAGLEARSRSDFDDEVKDIDDFL